MKAKIYILTACMSFLFLALTCYRESDNCHVTINLRNDSNMRIYIKVEGFYPKTYIHFDVTGKEAHEVNPGDINNKGLKARSCYEDALRYNSYNSYFPADTIMVFVYDAELVENTPWERVEREYLILKRYDLSLQDLQNLNWLLTYPPDERMKNMKMYPPYDL
jgi:hypothetical protein